MLDMIKALFIRELSLATTAKQCEDIKRAYLGKNGIIRGIERVLWQK